MEKNEKMGLFEDFLKKKLKIYTLYYKKQNPSLALDEIKEIMQNICLKVVEKIEQFDPTRGAFTTWISAIIKNSIKDYLRSKGRHGYPVQPDSPAIEAAISTADDSDLRIMRKQMFNLVFRQIKLLGSVESRVIILQVLLGNNDKKIADILNMKPGAVRTARSRALNKLSSRLKGNGFFNPDGRLALSDLHLRKNELDTVIRNPCSRQVFAEYFFAEKDAESVIEDLNTDEDSFYNLICSGLDDIARARYSRDKAVLDDMAPPNEILGLALIEAFFFELDSGD